MENEVRLIECRSCDCKNCSGCNVFTLANMLHNGDFDCLMDEHKSIAFTPESLRPKGRWIDTGESYEDEHCRYNYWACSVCENRIAGRYGLHNYCPNCGADMRGEVDDK